MNVIHFSEADEREFFSPEFEKRVPQVIRDSEFSKDKKGEKEPAVGNTDSQRGAAINSVVMFATGAQSSSHLHVHRWCAAAQFIVINEVVVNEDTRMKEFHGGGAIEQDTGRAAPGEGGAEEDKLAADEFAAAGKLGEACKCFWSPGADVRPGLRSFVKVKTDARGDSGCETLVEW